MRDLPLIVVLAATLAACSSANGSNSQAGADPNMTLRKLVETEHAAVPRSRDFPLKGDRVATPSDALSDYYLLRARTAVTGKVIAILRQERGNRVAYARTETDCRNRRMHILGVGPTRADAEVAIVHDGPLRSIEGLPLRVELATAICESTGTPLTTA